MSKARSVAEQVAALTGDDAILKERPPNTITTLEYAAHLNITDTSARERLNDQVKLGTMRRLRVKLPKKGIQLVFEIVSDGAKGT